MKRPHLKVLFAIALLAGCSKRATEERAPRETPKRSAPKGRLGKYVLDAPPKVPTRLDYEYEGKVILLGYKLDPPTIQQGTMVKLTLYWHLKEKLKGNWKLSTHVLDGLGEMVLDLYDKSPLREGPKGRPALRPSRWQAGKYYVDELSFTLPANLTADQIRVVAGVYSTDALRMKVTKGPKDAQERATIGTFDVSLAAGSKSGRLPRVSLERIDANETITIDGKLDEPAWQTAPQLSRFVDPTTADQPGDTGPKASARLLWGEQGFYVAYEIEEKDVLGGLAPGAKDPSLSGKDSVGMILDPDADGDGKGAYEIRINPQNLVFDASFEQLGPKGQGAQKAWSSGGSSAVAVNGTIDKSDDTDKGYVVEAMVPWKSLSRAKHAPPEVGDIWRLNLYATDKDTSVSWAAPLDAGNLYVAPRFAKVRFVTKGWTPPEKARPSASGAPASSASGRPPAAPRESSGAAAPPKPAASQ